VETAVRATLTLENHLPNFCWTANHPEIDDKDGTRRLKDLAFEACTVNRLTTPSPWRAL
jgi:hypothetical protein